MTLFSIIVSLLTQQVMMAISGIGALKTDIFTLFSKNGWGINVMYLNEETGVLGFGSTDGAMVVHDFRNDTEFLGWAMSVFQYFLWK